MATNFDFNTSPFIDFDEFQASNQFQPSNEFLNEFPVLGESDLDEEELQELLSGLGLGGAAFAAQTGRAPTPVPPGPLSSFAQQVAANDAARNAAARSTLARTTTAAAGFLSRFSLPSALLGIVDLGSRAFTGKGIGELGGEIIGNAFFPGAKSLPAAFGDETLDDLAARGGYSPPEDDFLSGDDRRNPTITPPNFFNPEAGRGTYGSTKNPIPEEVPEEVIAEFSPASNLFSPESAAEVNPMLRQQNLESFAPTIEDSGLPPQTLSQFMRYEDDPSQRTEQFVDAQGRLRRRLTPEATALQGFAPGSEVLAPEFADFEQASADRLARLEERDLLPGETQTQRDTRLANAMTEGSDNVPMDVIEAVNTPSNRRTKDQVKRISRWESSSQGKAMGGVAGLVQDRTQFEPRVVEIDGQRLVQLSPTYYTPVRPEPTEEEKLEPRVIESNGIVYFEVAPNRFKEQPSSDFEKVQDMIDRAKQLGITMNSDGVGLYTEKQEENIQRVMAEHSVSRTKAINEMRQQGFL